MIQQILTRPRGLLLTVLLAIASSVQGQNSSQQPITFTPATLQSGSPILFRAALPEA